MGDGEYLGHLVVAGGNVDEVDVSFQLLRDLDALFDVVAALMALAAAYADLDGESGAYGLAARFSMSGPPHLSVLVFMDGESH